MVVVDADHRVVQQPVRLQPLEQRREHVVGQARLGEQPVDLVGAAVVQILRVLLERVGGQRVDLVVAEVAAVGDDKAQEGGLVHHALIKLVTVDQEFIHARLQLALRVVQRGIILLIAERLMHRAAVVELGLALVERVRGVARILKQTAHRVRERATAERIGDVAVRVGINAGLRGELGVKGVAVGILRGVKFGKVDALALQARERGGVFLVQHEIIHALELHQNQVFAREQTGHLVVLMRGALVEKCVDLRRLFRCVRIGHDRQPRIAQHELVRPGQREVVGRGGKPLVLISA